MGVASADTVIAYITHDDWLNISSASSRHGAKRSDDLCQYTKCPCCAVSVQTVATVTVAPSCGTVVGGGDQLHRGLAHRDDRSDAGTDHSRADRLRRSSAAGQLLLHRQPRMSLTHSIRVTSCCVRAATWWTETRV